MTDPAGSDRAQRRFQALIEHSADAITLLNAAGEVVYDSPAAPGLLGYSPETWLGKNIFGLFHPDDAERMMGEFQRLIADASQPVHSQFRLKHADGRWLWIDAHGANLLADPDVEAIVVNYRDISAEMQAIENLQSREDYLEGLMNTLGDAVLTVHFPSRLINFVNQAVSEIFGYAPEELLGKTTEMLYPNRETFLAFGENLRQGLEAGERQIRQDIQMLRKNGEVFWASTHVTFFTQDGVPANAISVVRDISEKKQAEEKLRTSENRLRAIFEHEPECVKVVSKDGLLQEMNPAGLRMLGIEQIEEIRGRPALELIHPDDHMLYQGLHKEASRGQTGQMQFRIFGPQNRILWVDSIATPLPGANGKIEAVLSVTRDITEQKEAEAAREHAAAMLRERIKELTTLHRASQLFQQQADSPLAVLQELASLLPSGWQYPEITAARILYDGLEFTTPNYAPTAWRLAAPVVTSDNKVGEIEVVYLEERPQEAEGPFLPEERELLNTLAEMLRGYLDRHQAETQIHRHFNHLTAIHTIDSSITSTLDLGENFQVLLEQAVIQLDVEAADILLLDETGESLKYIAGQRFKKPPPKQIGLVDTYAGDVIQSRKIVAYHDQAGGKSIQRTPFWKAEGFHSYYGSPLVAKGQVKGVLEVFSTRPITPDDEWLTFFQTLADQGAVAVENAELFAGLERSNLALAQSYDITLEGWTRALDLRDKETEGHTRRVTEMTVQLAAALGSAEDDLVHIRRGALLHDIGKLGIPDRILLKPEPLTEEEWLVMRQHPVYAYEWLSPIEVLHPALDIPYAHHERWDGSGYPRGLKGEEIPLAARIFAVVDVWDALRSDRPYRPAWSAAEALRYIRKESGTHFDPQVVRVFLQTFADTTGRR